MLTCGKVVKLVNGSFDMTVKEVNADTVVCSWFTGTTLNTATFYIKDIKEK